MASRSRQMRETMVRSASIERRPVSPVQRFRMFK
jgi:hypothetical protein